MTDKIRLRIVSDLHGEFWSPDLFPQEMDTVLKLDDPEWDILVLAGDTCTPKLHEALISKLIDIGKPAVLLMGNHDYYGSSFNSVNETLKSLQKKLDDSPTGKDIQIVFDRQIIEMFGIRFVCTPLWFPYSEEEFDHDTNRVWAGLNDFHFIETNPRQFAKEVAGLNKKAVKFLKENITSNDIIVTHHIPTFRHISSIHRSSPLNRYFLCDIDSLILEKQPSIWIHGHTHTSFDTYIGRTRVICNPMGYWKSHQTMWENKGFNCCMQIGV